MPRPFEGSGFTPSGATLRLSSFSIPHNVNFAVSAGTAGAFLDGEGVPYETAPSDDAMEPVEVAAAARKFTVLVECWK